MLREGEGSCFILLSLQSIETMIPIEAERHENIVTVATDTKKRMYAVIHLSVPAGFDPSDFTLSRVGPHKWKLAFDNVVTAHRFKRLLDEAARLAARPTPEIAGSSSSRGSHERKDPAR